MGIEPDYIIGDFDSLGEIEQSEKVIRFKVEKDDTDTALAIKHGIAKGFKLFYIFGATGGRLDHTIANIQCLVNLSRNSMRGYLISENQITTAITNDEISFDEKHSGNVSVFAYGSSAKGVYEKGLKYKLENAVVYDDVPLGVSNMFIGKNSSIKVTEGTLVAVWDRI